METCAVVCDGVVINLIVASPGDLAPDGCDLIDVGERECGIGWTWDGTDFIAPPPVEEPTPPLEEAPVGD